MYRNIARVALLACLVSCAGPSGNRKLTSDVPAPRFGFAPADAKLEGFIEALDGIAGTGRQVSILQIGDSHTANDSFASALRDRLQARFGNAGRGVLQPGIPFKWYRPEAVTVSSAGFTAISAFSSTSTGPFGIAAVRQHADGPADATLSETDGGSIDFAEVELYAQPGGGSVQIAAPPAAPRTVSTAGAPGPFWARVPVAPGASTITLHANGDGPVDWLSWSVHHASGGVSLSNLGIPGSTIALTDRWDPGVAAAELAHIQPALIIVAFGTNEGFKPSLDQAAYEQDFEQRLQFLHQAAPGASLVVFGAPDGQRKRRRGVAEGVVCNAQWAIPPYLPDVRALAQQAAARAGAYYWDWSAPMGGPCSMAAWAAAVPPLGMPDHVHMRTPGYAITANALFDVLMRAYNHYLGLPGGA